MVQNIKLQRTSAEHGFDDFDVTGHPEIHRVAVGHGLQRGGRFNVYGPESTKRGATWCGSVEASLASFWKVSQEAIQVCMELREIDKRTALAEEEFDRYAFGDGVTVAGRNTWDVTDQNDLTLIVYVDGGDGPTDADSERVSFHVRFNADGTVNDAYGLRIRNGSDIGFRPADQSAMNAMSETWSSEREEAGKMSAEPVDQSSRQDVEVGVYDVKLRVDADGHLTIAVKSNDNTMVMDVDEDVAGSDSEYAVRLTTGGIEESCERQSYESPGM